MGFSTGEDWVNAGSVLTERDPWQGQKLISEGIKILGENGIAFYNLGIALHMQERPEAAVRSYLKSLESRTSPTDEVHTNLAHDLLLSGSFKEGWKQYDYRLRKEEYAFFEELLGKSWRADCKDDPIPKEIILVGEQGFGDTIQFCRYALELQDRGAEVTLFCQRQLVELLAENSLINHVKSKWDPRPDTSGVAWCPLLSVPGRLRLNGNGISERGPYISKNEELMKCWASKLQRNPGKLLVGLHWQGNIKHEKSLYSRGRSLKSTELEVLAGIEGVEYVLLQKGEARNQINSESTLELVEGQKSFDSSLDFRDTSAVISLCDLVISGDSGVIHLSGALGVETWLALRWAPEWRWGLNSEKTPWYRSVKLFRQHCLGEWAPVFDRIRKDLIEFVNNKKVLRF